MADIKSIREKVKNSSNDIDNFSMEMNGTSSLILENFKRVNKYLDNEVSVQCRRINVTITGNRLEIQYITKYDLKIVGEINEISFVR